MGGSNHERMLWSHQWTPESSRGANGVCLPEGIDDFFIDEGAVGEDAVSHAVFNDAIHKGKQIGAGKQFAAGERHPLNTNAARFSK